MRRSVNLTGILACCALISCPRALAQVAGVGERAREERPDIVVVGKRLPGSLATDEKPVVFDRRAIADTGATTIGELMKAVRASSRSADGSDAILLLNGRRIASFDEIGALPPEALERMEVYPEAVAAQLGYPPTRKVMNFITLRHFRALETETTGSTTSDGGANSGGGTVSLVRLRGDTRITLKGEFSHQDQLLESQRRTSPDTQLLFDTIGNVAGKNGGEIDPALSLAIGAPATTAAVPAERADRYSLAGYVSGANNPRVSDVRRFRTLSPQSNVLKFTAGYATPIGSARASFTASATINRDRSLQGLGTSTIDLGAANPNSPFASEVVVYRYIDELPPLARLGRSQSFRGSAAIDGFAGDWSWNVLGSHERQEARSESQIAVDPVAIQALVAAGGDPFAPLTAPGLLELVRGASRSASDSSEVRMAINGSPMSLPAGPATLSLVSGLRRDAGDIFETVGDSSSATHFVRVSASQVASGVLPIASRRNKVLPGIGELSANFWMMIEETYYGPLFSHSYGITWSLKSNFQIQSSIKWSRSQPLLSLQAIPTAITANTPYFDFVRGENVLITSISGANPDLRPERRRTSTISVSYQPFAEKDLRVSARYSDVAIRDRAGFVSGATMLNEAIFPELFQRDGSGRLISVSFIPVNVASEIQRTIGLDINYNGRLGRPPASPKEGEPPPPDSRPSIFVSLSPSLLLDNRARITLATPYLDLLRGDTIDGSASRSRWEMSGFAGLTYSAINFSLMGSWGSRTRVRSDNAASDIRFSDSFALSAHVRVALEQRFPKAGWAKRTHFGLAVENLTNSRRSARDRNGNVPYRYQGAYLDPLGRVVRLSLRKLF